MTIAHTLTIQLIFSYNCHLQVASMILDMKTKECSKIHGQCCMLLSVDVHLEK